MICLTGRGGEVRLQPIRLEQPSRALPLTGFMRELLTDAERFAVEASALPAFSGIDLLHIKRKLEEMLSLIGKSGVFEEYTVHDVRHVDEMLRILDWLIPQETRDSLTPAEWLLIVLSIYFHDLGMLVTKDEFARRGESGFSDFCQTNLFAGSVGEDYRTKIEMRFTDPGERDRFLYQEFVRHTHAERVRQWIAAQASPRLGISDSVASELDLLLGGLDVVFRRDLAVVCESHHLDDLGDLSKYKASQPYGNSEAETANVQYCAILLRSADLLHITQDRTPAVTFRLINPSDPISQKEWAKQAAVRRVRPRKARDADGNISATAPTDTIEVHALFDNADGFFGLTSYLRYAESQLKKSAEWVEAAGAEAGLHYTFPWRFIDDSNVEASGFLRQPFQFSLDQARILDLLTGHTLYNNSGVVLRELVQNALDAVRLQEYLARIDGEPSGGRVKIEWDSESSVLRVEDNGTGMTQSIIENHLLRAGSSRYQDPDFKKQHPGFSSISRFGIGVLSCFMIADEVEVLTSHPSEPEARQLTLRSVHGKYLIRLLNKETDPLAKQIGPHGTRISLRVRPSAPDADFVKLAREWILFPCCPVTIEADLDKPIRIGFGSPKEALVSQLQELGLSVGDSKDGAKPRQIRVLESEEDAVSLAFAVEWSPYFRSWSFVHPPKQRRASPDQEDISARFGTALEGIRVYSGTPGFDGLNIAAVANIRGPRAPATNVARSGLESTPELAASMRLMYRAYCNHLESEIGALHTERDYSLSWAVQEASYLLAPLSRSDAHPRDPKLLAAEISRLPTLLVERGGDRTALSPEAFANEPAFWTIDWSFLHSAEQLIREAPGSLSFSDLLRITGVSDASLPDEPVLTNGYPVRPTTGSAFHNREVQSIVIHEHQRRVDLRWVDRREEPIWRSLPFRLLRKIDVDAERGFGTRDTGLWDIRVAAGAPSIENASGYLAVRAFRQTYLLPGTAFTNYALRWMEAAMETEDTEEIIAAMQVLRVAELFLGRDRNTPLSEDDLEAVLSRTGYPIARDLDLQLLTEALNESRSAVFDPSAWRRRTDEI